MHAEVNLKAILESKRTKSSSGGGVFFIFIVLYFILLIASSISKLLGGGLGAIALPLALLFGGFSIGILGFIVAAIIGFILGLILPYMPLLSGGGSYRGGGGGFSGGGFSGGGVVLVEAEPQEVGNEIQFKKFFITGRYR